MTILCRPGPRDSARRCLNTCAAARPSFRAVSAVTGSTLAVPRTPSVPKIFFCLEPLFVSIALLRFSRFDMHVRGPITLQSDVARQPDVHREGPMNVLHIGEADVNLDVVWV